MARRCFSAVMVSEGGRPAEKISLLALPAFVPQRTVLGAPGAGGAGILVVALLVGYFFLGLVGRRWPGHVQRVDTRGGFLLAIGLGGDHE